MMRALGAVVFALWLAGFGLAAAEDKAAEALSPEQRAFIAKAQATLDSEHPQWGDIKLKDADVVLHLAHNYYFLGAEDARRVIVDEWKNPPDAAKGVLGLVFPSGQTFVDSWGAVLTYDPAGYVPDKDAQSADYDKLLKQSRSGEDEDNSDRQKNGFPGMHLTGWAQPPTYDKARHSEIWARDIKIDGEAVDTLNYDIRVLGRRGVFSLNLISEMNELDAVRTAAADLGKAVQFEPGARYEDYQDGLDKKASFGVAGLIAAGLGVAAAQKFGLLAVLLLFAKKGFIVIAALLAGGWAKLKRAGGSVFARRKAKPAPAAVPPDSLAPVGEETTLT